LSRPQHDNRGQDRRGRRRQRRGPNGERRDQPAIILTEEGVPAATPDAPLTSPVVFVSDESRTRFPWLPGRVIAGSVWRGPGHQRVQVDGQGEAFEWLNGHGAAHRLEPWRLSTDPEPSDP
jgi:hypothetical protein